MIERLPEDLPSCSCRSRRSASRSSTAIFPARSRCRPSGARGSWTEIGESVARAGCRKLVLLNAHGGNTADPRQVALDLRARCGMLVVVASWHRFGYPDGLFSGRRNAARHPWRRHRDLADAGLPAAISSTDARRDDFAPRAQRSRRDFTWLRADRPIGFGWMTQDLSRSRRHGRRRGRQRRKGEADRRLRRDGFCRIVAGCRGVRSRAAAGSVRRNGAFPPSPAPREKVAPRSGVG